MLSVVVADYLFTPVRTVPEGELTRMRASLVVRGVRCSNLPRRSTWASTCAWASGEDLGGGRNRPSIVSDAFEAVIAALYLDGGMEAARDFILPFVTDGPQTRREEDYKTQLQEVVQQDPQAPCCAMRSPARSGPDHAKKFTVLRMAQRRTKHRPKPPAAAKKPAEQQRRQTWHWRNCG